MYLTLLNLIPVNRPIQCNPGFYNKVVNAIRTGKMINRREYTYVDSLTS